MPEDRELRGLGEGDRELLRSMQTGEGLIPITSMGQLEALASMAKETYDYFSEQFTELTKEQAEFVRKLRVDEGYSWRALAEACYLEWNGDWDPPSNQLAGMALCETAAKQFGEQYMEEPWN